MGEEMCIKKMQSDLNELRKSNERLAKQILAEREAAKKVHLEAEQTEREYQAVIMHLIERYTDDGIAVVPKHKIRANMNAIEFHLRGIEVDENIGGDYLLYIAK